MVFILGTHYESTHWVNIEPCGLICGCMTYFLLGYGMYATSNCVIVPWLGYSLHGIFHLVFFNLVSLMGCYSHFKAMTTDPGAVPKHAKPLLDDADENDFEANETTERFKKFCKRCRAFKPHRAHHCSLCGRCIVKMDHHCPWVNNCVGVGNHKLFLQFLFWVFSSCIYSLVLVSAKYIRCLMLGDRCNSDIDEHLLVIFLVVEAILFALFTLCMLGDQISSIATNQTQIDRLKKTKFKQQTEINEVFGSPAAVWCARDWMYPVPIKYPDTTIKSLVLGYRLDSDEQHESQPLMCEPTSPLHAKRSLPRVKVDSNKHLSRNVTAMLKGKAQVNDEGMSDDSSYDADAIQDWIQEPQGHSNALMQAALHEVEMVSNPGSVDSSLAPVEKDDRDEATARLIGSSNNINGSGSNGSITNVTQRKRV